MRVPMPGRNLPREAAREARGFADSFALRLRHHNAAHAPRAMPAEPAARACYDTIERVRYEALGENNYAGMRDNLAAATDLRTRSDPIARADHAERGAAAYGAGADAARAADRPADPDPPRARTSTWCAN